MSVARRRYFAALLIVQAAFFAWLVLTRRLPRGHDTLSVYLLQSIFLSGTPSGSTPALWMPYLAHGFSTPWLANVQSGLLQNALLLMGGVPKGTPLHAVFYAGLFLEDLILVLGIWRLGGRFFRTPSAQFFVAAAALGSSMWIDNIFWAHRLIYGVPLTLSLILDFVETGRRLPLLLASSLAGLLLLGNAVYIPIASNLSVLLFVALYVFIHRRRLRASLPLLRPRPADAAWLAAILVVPAVCAAAVVLDLGSVRQYARGRNVDGSVTLDGFLTYAGGLNPLKFLDLFLGATPSLDFSVYAGLCTPIFAVLAFVRRPRKNVIVAGISLLLLLLFGMGYLNAVGMLAYTAMPPLHYFRYIALTCGLVKLLLIVLSGFGFDALVVDASRPGRPRLALAGGLGALLLIQWGFLAIRPGAAGDLLAALLWALRDNLVQRRAEALQAFGTGLAILLGGVAAVVFAWRRRRGAFPLAAALLLVVHGTDLLRWRFQMFREETHVLTPEQDELQRARSLDYIPRRTARSDLNPRLRIFNDQGFENGTLYDYRDAFLRHDASWSRWFVTQWSPPVDVLLRAHARRSLAPDPDLPPPFVTAGETRTRPEAYARVIGEDADKLQFFRSATAAGSDESIAATMNRPEYQGNILLLSGGSGIAPDPARNDRLELPYRVTTFSPVQLSLQVDIPADCPEAWLVSCDSWHPGWSATVDGVPRTVSRANLAYKAVPLHPGRNVVEWRFRSPLRSACYLMIGGASIVWIALLAVWTLRALKTA